MVDRATPVSVLVTVTDALGTNAPLGSRVSPLISPPVWAKAANATPKTPTSSTSPRMQIPSTCQIRTERDYHGIISSARASGGCFHLVMPTCDNIQPYSNDWS